MGTRATVPARLSLGSESLEEDLPLHEGKMRVRLPESWTLKTIEWLKKGEEVAIKVGSIEQTIQPERFSEHFKQLAKDYHP